LSAGLAWRPVTRFGAYIGDLQFFLTVGGVTGALIMPLVMIPSNLKLALFEKQGLMLCIVAAAATNGAAGILLLLAYFKKVSWVKWGGSCFIDRWRVLGLFRTTL